MNVRSSLLKDIVDHLPRIITVRRGILHSQTRLLTTSKQISWFLRWVVVIIIIVIVVVVTVASMRIAWTLI